MPQLFETAMGRKYYEATMPRIAKALERIADAMEAAGGIATYRVSFTERNVSGAVNVVNVKARSAAEAEHIVAREKGDIVIAAPTTEKGIGIV
jgi:hypothetical protein